VGTFQNLAGQENLAESERFVAAQRAGLRADRL